MRYSIELRTTETIAEVLEKIAANTEREILPFVSPARQTGALGVKPLVASISGNGFRVWRVPIASKRRQRCYRYLRGEVRDVNGERLIVGSFKVHPSRVIFALIPFATAAVIWVWGIRSTENQIFIAPLLCVLGLAMFASALRPRPQEETEILTFLRRLFPDAQFNVK